MKMNTNQIYKALIVFSLSLPLGKGWGWASVFCIMLLSPLFWRGVGSEALAQVANGTGAGNCLSYNGTSNYVQVPNNAVFNMTSNITVEFWVKANPSQSDIWLVIDKSHGGAVSNYSGWLMQGNQITYNGKLQWGFGNGTDWTSVIISTIPINDGNWHQIAGTYDGATIKLYIDGVLNNSQAETRAIATNTRNVMIGKHYYLDRPFNGALEEIRVWNVARTETEIRDNMCKKLTGSESGLVGYWRFDEGSGGTAYDATTNGNNGTLY